MMAPVDMQQHAGQRTPRPPLAMGAALALVGYQPRRLQGRLHPVVTEIDRMLLA
jgi:hypothetical protein